MPYNIKQSGEKYCVYKEGESEPLKCYPTKKEAVDYMAALYANEKSNKAIQFTSPVPIMDIKSDGDDWEVSGYISIFNNIDLGGDIVLPGAFKKSLSSGRKVKFLLSHDPKLVLGVPKLLKEDTKGCLGNFKISKTRLGEETHQLLQDGALDSFSIGYRAEDENYTDDGIRELKEIQLFEASLVAMPMNPEAVVTGFKDMPIAEQTAAIATQLQQLIDELRGLVDKDRPLSITKQQEIAGLLDTLSGMDAVRSELQKVLTAQPVSLVTSHRLVYQLAQLRKRHPEFIKE